MHAFVSAMAMPDRRSRSGLRRLSFGRRNDMSKWEIECLAEGGAMFIVESSTRPLQCPNGHSGASIIVSDLVVLS